VLDAFLEHDPDHRLRGVLGSDGDDVAAGVVQQRLPIVGTAAEDVAPGDDPDEASRVDDRVGPVTAR
jgi:hypothetical protein